MVWPRSLLVQQPNPATVSRKSVLDANAVVRLQAALNSALAPITSKQPCSTWSDSSVPYILGLSYFVEPSNIAHRDLSSSSGKTRKKSSFLGKQIRCSHQRS